MKKILVLILSLLAITIHAQKSFVIKGQLNESENNATVILRKSFSDTISISPIVDGKFTLEGYTQKDSEKLNLVISVNGKIERMRSFWISPGETSIKGTSTAMINLWDIRNTSKEQQEINKYIAASYKDIAERESLQSKIRPLYLKRNAKETTEEEKEEIKSQIAEIQTQLNEINSRIQKTELSLLDLSETVTDVWIDKLFSHSARLVTSKDKEVIDKIYTLYSRMDDTQKDSRQGKYITANIKRYELIGKPIPNPEFKDLDGNVHSLSEYKGKYLIIDFWASWCGPCIMAFPQLKALKEKYGDKLNVVSINVDGDYNIWKEASEKHGLTWGNISEGKSFRGEDGFHKEFMIDGIPYYLFVSPDGILLDSWAGFFSDPTVMDNRVKKLMGL